MQKTKKIRGKEMRIIAAYVGGDIYNQVEQLADKTGMSMSGIVNECTKASIDEVSRVLHQLPSLKHE